MANQTQRATNQPAAEFAAGQARATIWANEAETQDGRHYTEYSIRVRKEYFDEATQAWKSSNSFFPNELPEVILVTWKAYEFIRLRDRSQDSGPFPAEPAQA